MIFGRGTRRRIVPEIVQTSAMDCGPAALKSLLEGFGIRASYGRLREACQTHLDGTSIDTIEEVAKQLGLDPEQVMVPVDHLMLPEARCLPAMVVVRLPGGDTFSGGGGDDIVVASDDDAPDGKIKNCELLTLLSGVP